MKENFSLGYRWNFYQKKNAKDFRSRAHIIFDMNSTHVKLFEAVFLCTCTSKPIVLHTGTTKVITKFCQNFLDAEKRERHLEIMRKLLSSHSAPG